MAEMSFGNRRSTAYRRNDEAMPSFNPVAFFQGCIASRPETFHDKAPLVVDFPDRPSKMLAAVLPDYGSAKRFKVQMVDLPRLPMGKLKSTEVLVEVHAAGVNPTDWKQRKGTLSQIFPLTLPCILGIDFSGRVVRAGEDAPFSEGDEVFGRQTLHRMTELNGSYAEYCIADSQDIFHKPENLSHKQAAGVPLACLAAYACLARIGKLLEKRTAIDKAVLILGGSGGVGTFAVQLAKHHFGCYVIASCSSKNAELLRALGADEVLDYEDPAFLKSMGYTKLDAIVDCVGGDDYWVAFKPSLKADGVYVTLVGSERHLANERSIDYTLALQIQADYFMRQISNKIGATQNYHILTGSQLQSSDLKIVASLLEEGTIKVVGEKSFSLYDISLAHELSESRHAVGKIVIEIRADKEEGNKKSEEAERGASTGASKTNSKTSKVKFTPTSLPDHDSEDEFEEFRPQQLAQEEQEEEVEPFYGAPGMMTWNHGGGLERKQAPAPPAPPAAPSSAMAPLSGASLRQPDTGSALKMRLESLQREVQESTRRVQDLKKQTLASSSKVDETLSNFSAAPMASNGSISKPILKQKMRKEEEEEVEAENGRYIVDVNRTQNGHSQMPRAPAVREEQEPIISLASKPGAPFVQHQEEREEQMEREEPAPVRKRNGKNVEIQHATEISIMRAHRQWEEKEELKQEEEQEEEEQEEEQEQHSREWRQQRDEGDEDKNQNRQHSHLVNFKFSGLRSTVAAAMCNLAGICSDDVVLDPACGRGSILLEGFMSHSAAQFVGLDSDIHTLRATSKHLSSIGISPALVQFIHGDFRAMPFRGRTFTKVVVDLPFGCKHKIPSVQAGHPQPQLHGETDAETMVSLLLQETGRVLRGGGTMCCLTAHADLFERQIQRCSIWTLSEQHPVQLGLKTGPTILLLHRKLVTEPDH